MSGIVLDTERTALKKTQVPTLLLFKGTYRSSWYIKKKKKKVGLSKLAFKPKYQEG